MPIQKLKNDSIKNLENFKKIDNIYKEYHELSDRYNKYDNVINIYYLNNVLKNIILKVVKLF